MATILYSTSYGSDDATRATIPFVAALGALEAGHQPQIALLGEATYLMKDSVAAAIHGVGFAPLSELLAKAIENEIPIHT